MQQAMRGATSPSTARTHVTRASLPARPCLGCARPLRLSRGTLRVAAYTSVPPPPPPPTWNPVEVVKREQGLQSNKLPTALRESVSNAVEELRFRVTVGDVAARAGVKLQEADDTLKALAYDSLAALEVSEQGDVVYNFPRDFRSSVRARSLWLSAAPALAGARKVFEYLVRVLFGTALMTSVAVVWLAITVLLSSRGDSRDDRRDSGRGYYGGGYGGGGARMFFNITDLLLYFDPNYGPASRERSARGQLSFIEAIFSFVFGDGDPNAEFDATRWAALGQMIQDRGGVVTAEEMAPYLDPPSAPMQLEQGAYPEESFVLPALIRFGGEPIVDEESGTLMYRFPSLQTTGITQEVLYPGRGGRPSSGGRASTSEVEVVQEQPWDLTAASSGQVMGVVALGVFNVVGVLTLSSLLTDPQARYALSYQGLGWVANIMPGLQLYAATFFGIPLVRSLFNSQRNAAISQRNSIREQAARLLGSGKRWLQEKLGRARRAGRTRTVRKSDVVFTSDKEATQQVNELDMSDWDRKLGKQSQLPAPTRPPPPGMRTFAKRPPTGEAVDREAARQQQRLKDFDGRWK